MNTSNESQEALGASKSESKMLEIVLKKLAAKKQATAADLRGALSVIDEQSLVEALRGAEDTRRKAIMAGSDDAVLDRCAEAVLAAQRKLENARIARAELIASISLAEQREADEAVARERVEIERETNAIIRDVQERWRPAEKALIDLLARLDTHVMRIANFNKKRIDAGHGDGFVAEVDKYEIVDANNGLLGAFFGTDRHQ